MTGNAGQTIKDVVIISPSEKNPFKITGIRMEKGENIRYDLSEIEQPDGLRYRISIYNTKKEKGWYIDKIFVKTSSQVTPEFKIRVMGVIRDG
ncbi:MAG: hypothetical protein KGY61_06590 [Desulfobacterales bacterium]|nr:hypothetical protein [Desulfobacterales bacterium]